MCLDTPMKPYSEIESDWIRQEIKDRDFENATDREFVNTLVAIEHYVLEGADSFASGMRMNRLKRQHPEKYDRIQRELRPDQYRARKKREREREEQANRRAAKRKARQQQRFQEARDQWERIGGEADD